MDDREKSVYNEQIKLFATFLNSMGVALTVGGGFLLAWQALASNAEPNWKRSFAEMFAVVLGFMLHKLGSLELEKLIQ
jgi:hypothetical protein